MYLLIILLPLISSLFILLFGRYIGLKGSEKIIIIINSLLFIIIHFIIFEILYKKTIIEINLQQWIIINNKIGFIFDSQSIIMVYLIIIIYIIVINYSIWYMNEDNHKIRFFAFLNIFTFMMIWLVLSKNILIMLIGWEGVGLTSYLLINFWYTRIQANKSAIKAILWNKIGDCFYILSLIMMIIYKNNLSFNKNYIIFSNYNNFILIFFLLAAMAKSAQILFDSWLGDAMEGPTPVSALLHAATMVTAGIYLLLRIIPVLPNNISIFGTTIGLLTIILGGLIGLFQNDIKKIIAYSTCSQLGYMFYSEWIGIHSYSFYHLLIHGYFKALLFLSAGLIIHNMNNKQDIRQFGSLILNFPLSYLYFIIGTLSITSWPFYSGFYSKESIIEFSYIQYIYIYILSIFGALLTISYSFRIVYNVFFNKPKKKLLLSHEPIIFSFLFLILGSLFLGYFLKSLFFNPTLSYSNFPFYSNIFDLEFLSKYIRIIPIFLIIIGIILGKYLDKIIHINLKIYIKYIMPIISLLNKRFFFDNIYNKLISIIEKNKIFKYIDNGIIDIYTYTKRFLTQN